MIECSNKYNDHYYYDAAYISPQRRLDTGAEAAVRALPFCLFLDFFLLPFGWRSGGRSGTAGNPHKHRSRGNNAKYFNNNTSNAKHLHDNIHICANTYLRIFLAAFPRRTEKCV